MKKWLIAVVIAGLGAGVGCETPESQPAEAQETTSAASAPESGEAEKAESEKLEGAPADKKQAELPEDLADGATGTYGGEFSVDGEPMTLAAAIQAAAIQKADGQQTYKVSADIEKVCKKKGCWFTLTGEGVDEPVRVKMKDYGFFVPKNADGAEAIVEGVLEKRVIPKKEAQHYADDEVAGTDKAPEKVEDDQVKWEMLITAAKISKS
jgi:hypothetical protein